MSARVVEAGAAGELLIVGDCSRALEGARGAKLRTWANRHGFVLTDTFEADRVVCAIGTEEVLDGDCSPADAMTMQAVRVAGIPCVCIHDAPERILEALGESRLAAAPAAGIPAGTVCTSVFAQPGPAEAPRDPQPA